MRSNQTSKPQAKPVQDRERRDERLDQELDDSFPASDPPQSTQPHKHIDDVHRSSGKVKKASRHADEK